jgi:ABC-type transport system involved in multi-copper enzyme maturation permease subunit
LKVRTIALSTFGGFLHSRVILLFGSLLVCVVLYGLHPMLTIKAMTTASNAQQMQGYILSAVDEIMSLVSGLGSLLAAWAAADSVAVEMKSGTILAVMARPLRRWQFLAGKYVAVLMLMSVYVVAMIGTTALLTWLGGQRFYASLWVLLVYPLVRYAIWAAISMFLVTLLLHPILTMGVVALIATLIRIMGNERGMSQVPEGVRVPAHLILPMTNLLSEHGSISMTQASLGHYSWTNHVIALAYGLNYALVCFLLTVVVFHYRSLSRP